MIYGYLRVSTDEQDVNSQRQGVDGFAAKRGLHIDHYITDEGISGAKDPAKRKLGRIGACGMLNLLLFLTICILGAQ